jgi:hypothetical protein
MFQRKRLSPDDLAVAMGELFKEFLDPIRGRLDALEADLEQRSHKGIWCADYTYKRHNSVTHHGCTWTAISDKDLSEPGKSQGWQLSVKKGRDGRDARDYR